MKLGHFVALCCFALALLGAAFVYWDLQDGYYSSKLLMLPIMTGMMGVALLLFPGGPTTFREAAQPNSVHTFHEWKHFTPRLHRRVWLVTAGLAFYLSHWADNYLEGKAFFTFREQLPLLLAFGLIAFYVRKEIRRIW